MERSKIVEEFKQFLKDPIPDLMNGYGDLGDRMVAKVFTIVEFSKLIDVPDDEYTFPIAKVYAVGKDWKGVECSVGSYVRLRDIDALRMDNPRHEVQLKNEFTKSNMTQIGKLEPKTIMNLWMRFYDRLFSPDPFEMDGHRWKTDVFFFDSGNVIAPIDKPEKFLI